MDWIKLFSSLVLCVILCADLMSCQQCPRMTLKNGRIKIRNRGHMVSFNCNEGFTRVGQRFSVCLNSGLWTQKKPLCVGNGCEPVELSPNLEMEELHGGAVRKFTCSPGFFREGPEEIYCDGTMWSSPIPTCVHGLSLGCDFEVEGMCGWSQDQSDDFDWTWHQGHTPTSDTGPAVDHTTNSQEGHYVYIESSAPTKKDYKARLVSPTYDPADVPDYCLQFYYHMQGPEEPGEMGHLDVYIQPAALPNSLLYPINNIFNIKGNKGDQWHRADFQIPNQSQPYKLIFQGTRMKSWNSDIALDDIKLYSCPEGPESLADSFETTERPTTSTEAPTTKVNTTDVGTNATSTDNATDATTTDANNNSTDLFFEPTHEDETHGMTKGSKNADSVGVRRVRDGHPATRAAAASTSSQILPVVIGVLIAVVIAVVFIAVIVWVVAKRKQKQDEELDDELKIINQGGEK